MVKTTKRARKFASKGGAKGMLEKGTITKKGKLKMRKKDSANGNSNANDARAVELRREMNRLKGDKMKKEAEEKREKDDFVGETNLGDLDLDSFLQNVTDVTATDGKEDDQEDTMDVDADRNDDSSDDDSMKGGESDSEGDDEDVEAAEKRMKEEMKKLAESDPDFHAYLQNNEASLLEFQSAEDGDDIDGDDIDTDIDGDGDETTEHKEEKKKKNTNMIVVNAKLLKSYETGAFESHGIKPLRKIISAYISACHMADAKDQNNDGSMGGKRTFHIESSTVFDKLMVTCLTKCHEEFHHHLLGKGKSLTAGDENDDAGDGQSSDSDKEKNENDEESNEQEIDLDKPINPRHLAKSVRWGQLKFSIQSFFKATLHLMTEAKEIKLLRFIIKSLSHYIPYLSAFPRLAKAVLKTLTSIWSSTSDSTPDYQSVRLNAFLRIRQMAITQPFPFIEQCLKATYLSYARSAKFANAATVTSLLPTLTFMGNCVVELYSLDYASSYQHAFVYIRQLALHLRTALQKKTPESFRVVYCWQYMHCLKLWTAVLAATCGRHLTSSGAAPDNGDDEMALMQSLIYPLVEIIFGVIRLVPTTRNLPLRLHCVRYLQQLAGAAEVFIPTTSVLLDYFDLKEVSMAPKRVKGRSSDVRGVRLPLILRLPKVDALRTPEQLDACFGEVFLLLNREIDLYRYSAGFPEFTIRICQRLRKFAKTTKNGRNRAFAKGCIELCEKHSKVAVLSRSKLEEAPKDIKRIEVLKPSNIPSMGERYEMAIAKEKRLEVAQQPVVSEAAKRRAKDEERKAKAQQEEKERERAIREKRNSKKKKQKIQVNEEDLKNVDALKEEDEIEEGIDWSESESEDMQDSNSD